MTVPRRYLVVLLSVVAVLIISAAWSARIGAQGRLWTLEVDMNTSAGTAAQVFWSDIRYFVEERSVRASLQPGAFETRRFPIPAEGVRWLRFDPTDAPGDVRIRRIQLVDGSAQVLKTFGAADLMPGNQISTITREGDVMLLRTAPDANDAFVYVQLGCLEQSVAQSLSLFTPAALALTTAAVIALVGACFLVIGRDAFGGREAVMAEVSDSARVAALWLTALVVAVVSAKLLLMRSHSVSVPYWDQWNGEAALPYLPFSECRLSWSQMFALHNEHRLFFPRVLALDLLLANGQWDPRLQQVVNAAIHGSAAAVLAVMLWVANGRRQLDLLVPAIALAFALPFGWENTLLGFQSTFYLLLLFSILALWLTTRYRGGSAAWLLGWLCALCALFAAANGVTVPVVIAAVVALKLLSDRSDWRSSLLTLTAAGAVVALGLLTASPPLPHHEPLAAKTLADLVGTLGRNLAWPWIQSPWLSVAMWLPIAGLSILVAARRGQTTPLQRMVLGLGFWVILQAAAIAYGRGAGAPAPAPRYQDFLSLGFVANSVALLIVFDVGPFRGTARRLATVALASWVAVAGVGLHRLVWSSLEQLSVFQPFFNAHTSNVRQFMLDGDIAKFASKQPLVELPYHTPQSLAGMLVEPYIRRILPAAVRAPVVVAPRASSGGSFVPNGTYPLTPSNPLLRSWGSYTAQGDATEGRFESEVLEPCRAGNHLQFEVAGYLGTGGLSLMIKDLPSGREREVAPAKPAKESWLPVQIACPAGSFQIVAVDGRADSWFAFREPVEVGVATPAAEWLIDVSPTLMVVAFAIALVAARSSARATAAGPS